MTALRTSTGSNIANALHDHLWVTDNVNKSGGFLAGVTPVILTYNEAPNIARVLDKLVWAREVLVVDSGSDDETLAICNRYANVRSIERSFDNHASQWNFAVNEPGIKTDWVLALDADYVLSPEFIVEMDELSEETAFAGFATNFVYCIFGKSLRGTLYPPVITLFKPAQATYVQDGHTQRLMVDGPVGKLQGVIYHDDRKPLSRWLWSQDRYAELEAELLTRKPMAELRIQDRLRRMLVVTPWLVPLYCLVAKRGILDGWPGVCYALQRGVAEAILSIKLIEARIREQ